MLGNFIQQHEALAGSVPLIIELLQLGIKGNAQRLIDRGGGTVAGVSKAHAEGEFGPLREVEGRGERNVAVQCLVVLMVHLEVVGKIGPTVIHSDITTRKTRERKGCRNR